jgi:hypothetical protein
MFFVKFKREEDAEKALADLNNRWQVIIEKFREGGQQKGRHYIFERAEDAEKALADLNNRWVVIWLWRNYDK